MGINMNAPTQPGHNQPAVIRADFADFRRVKTRKVFQLIFEVPEEQTEQVLGILGAPVSEKSIWCAIALLREPAESRQADWTEERRPWTSLKASQQAGIASKDPRFQEFARETADSTAVEFIYERCSIDTRTRLDVERGARDAWERLYADYRQWAGLEPEQRG